MAANRVELRRFGIPALVGLSVGMLVDCAEKAPPPPPQTAAVQPAAPIPPPPHRRVYRVPPRKPVPPAETAVLGIEAGRDGVAATGEAGNRIPTTEDLIGLDQAGITRLFGIASERADAPPATIWRYRAGHCELDLFFYLDLRSGKMRTLHYAVKGEPADAASRQDCLRSLVVARRE